MSVLLLLSTVGLFVNGLIPIKHIEVSDINQLTFADKSLLFEPISYLSANTKTSEHNINIFDQFGKFIRLNYFAQYGNHIKIFELKPNGLNDIKSVKCIVDNENTMKIQFMNTQSARNYANNINIHMENDESNKYFITGSKDWKCYNTKEKKYTLILREIITISNKDNLLTITTKYAAYTDLFEQLTMSLDTNANMDTSYKNNDQTPTFQSRRKLLCSKNNAVRGLLCDDTPSGSSLWDDIVNGVESLWDEVTSVVDDIADFVSDVEDIYEDATELIDALTTGDYTKTIDGTLAQWKYNYNGATSSQVLDLDSSVSCKSCYAFADLTYSIQITISNYELTYFKLVGTGDVKLNIEIEASEKYSDEFSTKTCQISVPDLGFSIAGIHFGFSIYGEFAVGIDVDMAFSYTIYATASITRGIEWDSSTNSQNYIEEQSFNHGSIGPILDFKSSSITVYGRATLYLVLSLVGDVYIGVQPKYIVSLSEDANYGSSSGCAVDYTPSTTITIFVGATINLAQQKSIWSKDVNIETYTLPAGSSGCITHSDITQLESWVDSVSSSWWRRRNLLALNSSQKTQFYVNYSSPKTVYKMETKWGKKNNLWSGNLTTMSDSCRNESIPNFGHLIIYPQNNNGDVLYGIYKTVNHISIDNNYTMTTDVNCVVRYKFIKNYKKNNGSMRIYRYDVQLMNNDYKCDVNDSIFNAYDKRKIFLPKQMISILLDSAFDSILLHDVQDCHIFTLTKNRKQKIHKFVKNDMNKFENNTFKWASKAWFGSFHCEDSNLSDSSTLYFNSIDWKTGTLNGTLLVNDNYILNVIGKLSINENDINDLTLDFDLYDSNNYYILTANGIISVLEDGCLLFSGITPKQPKCTGFIFQGYMDVDQFNDNRIDAYDVNGDEPAEINNVFYIGSIIGYVFIGVAITFILALILFCIMKKCYGYQFVKKGDNVQHSYALMQDQNL